jgi:hypothetical protein
MKIPAFVAPLPEPFKVNPLTLHHNPVIVRGALDPPESMIVSVEPFPSNNTPSLYVPA